MAKTHSRRDECANALTHGVGAALAVACLVLLVTTAAAHGSARAVVSAALFGASLTVLYTLSTVYHALSPGPAKLWLRRLDHSAIYLLIAGTYTPFCLITLKGAWGWSLFGVVWGLAVIGITLKTFLGIRWEALSVTLYVAMGWVVVVAVAPLVRQLPRPGLYWLLAGGLFYTGGLGFYLSDRRPFHHAGWHLCVLAGSACHVVAVLGWVLRT